MSSANRCRECGRAIPGESPGGYCAQCLLELGLEPRRESFGGEDWSTHARAHRTQDQTQPIEREPQPVTTISPALPTEKAGDRIGRYRLLQEIGQGGCG